MPNPATLTGACIISALNLLSPQLNDIATLDCELDKLQILVQHDGAEWDPFATACIGPTSLLSVDSCNKVPLFTLGDTPVHALYNPSKAEQFFDEQTRKDTDHCSSWFYAEPNDFANHGGETCGCEDLIALKTLNSHRRNAVLTMHEARKEAAESVRVRRKLAESVMQKALAYRCADAEIDCDAVRAVYNTDAATSEYIPSPLTKK
tara:strand:+ start:307 stop:924 length:618 start_codon:yes stop_codon:yes gene_type:complete